MSQFIEHSYESLLVDLSLKTKVRIAPPLDCETLKWAYIDGPKLDKQILAFLEGHRASEPEVPEWLIPLWSKFRLTDEPVLLRALRQVCLFYYKTQYDPTDEQLKEAQASFCYTEDSVGVCNRIFDPTQASLTLKSARAIISRVIARCDWTNLETSHGPGAVYPHLAMCDKSRFRYIRPDLEEVYPFDRYFALLPNYWDRAYSGLEEYDETVADCHLIAVPKDRRGPRLICVHNHQLIWLQQGQRRVLEHAISQSQAGPFINFKDQSVNANLALESSASREYCTLDLKEASDRLSCALVRFLFGEYVWKYISATRAKTVQLLDSRVVTLQKFAPMGNCITFPVQSIIFWALCRASIIAKFGSNANLNCFVFGDDIIVPTFAFEVVTECLTSVGLLINRDKSFSAGFFRESCGMDAYRGVQVTPHRLKRSNITSYSDVSSLCQFAKNMRKDGFEETSSSIYSYVRSHLRHLPLANEFNATGIYEYVERDIGWLIRNEPTLRWRVDYQVYAVPVLLPQATIESPEAHDWYHVQDSLAKLGIKSLAKPRGSSSLVERDNEVSDDRLVSSDTGVSRALEYTVPHCERFVRGWIPIRMDR